MSGGAQVVGALSANNLVLDDRRIMACNNAPGSALDPQKSDGNLADCRDQSKDAKFIVKDSNAVQVLEEGLANGSRNGSGEGIPAQETLVAMHPGGKEKK
jgi:hypothetical protein